MKIATKPKVYSVNDMYSFFLSERIKADSSCFINDKNELCYSSDKEIETISKQIKLAKEEYYNLIDIESKSSKDLSDISDIEISIKNFEQRKKELINDFRKIKKIIDFKTFKNILSIYNKKAGEEIIKGNKLNLLNGLGYIKAIRAERSHNSKIVNHGATNKLRDKDGNLPLDENGKKIVIYYTDEEWCRIKWIKVKGIKNISVYGFVPSGGQPGKGFRQAFSKAIKENPLLKLRYDFVPIKNKE